MASKSNEAKNGKAQDKKPQDYAEVMAEIERLRNELGTMKDALGAQNPQPALPKYLYGIRLLKLEDGSPHVEFLASEGQTVSLDQISGLVRWLDEKIHFWFQQAFFREIQAASAAGGSDKDEPEAEKADEGD